MNVALLVLRIVVGVLFAGHGAQKLFGWFGGHGLAGTGGFFDSLGLGPGRATALMAGMSELFGGLLFALGLVTPLATALISAVMFVAIMSVHWRQGLWVTEGGIEYPLVLVAVAFAVAASGPGEYSLDHAFGLDDDGVAWGVGAVAAGLLGALFAFAIGRLHARGEAGGPRPAGT